MFPELRSGVLPTLGDDSEGGDVARSSVKQMLIGASVLAAFEEANDNPELIAQYKQILECIAELELVHQAIVWSVYWKGQSMRNLASEWGIDELAVIREHKEILKYLFKQLSDGTTRVKKLKIRPGLRQTALELKRTKFESPFARFMSGSSAANLSLALIGLPALVEAFRFLYRT